MLFMRNKMQGSVNGIDISFHRVSVMLIVAVLLSLGCSSKNNIARPQPVMSPVPIIVESVEGFRWPDSNLQNLFQQYWAYRKSGDAVAAFEYEAPHIKEMIIWGKYERYTKTARTDWLSIRVEKMNRITDQLIEIDFNMIAKNRGGEGANRNVFFRDTWLFFSDKWFHVLKDPFVTGDGIGK